MGGRKWREKLNENAIWIWKAVICCCCLFTGRSFFCRFFILHSNLIEFRCVISWPRLFSASLFSLALIVGCCFAVIFANSINENAFFEFSLFHSSREALLEKKSTPFLKNNISRNKIQWVKDRYQRINISIACVYVVWIFIMIQLNSNFFLFISNTLEVMLEFDIR